MFYTFFKKRNNPFKKVLFIYLLVFLFCFNAVSSPCERGFSEYPFIQFAKEQLGEGFERGKVEDIKKVIKYLTSTELGLTEKDIKESMKKSFQGFAIAKLSELKEVVKYLTGVEIGLSKEDIKESMQKNLQSFAIAKLSELHQEKFCVIFA